MELSGNYIIVSKVFPSSPAEKAGLQQGDKIVEVDGKSLTGKSLEEAAALIRGETGTKVRLGIARTGVSVVKTYELTRDIVKINPVTYRIIGGTGGIGYVKIDSFNENTDEYLTNALDDMDKNKVKKLILDLRSDPGGQVDQAVEVARKFVPKGPITTLDYKSPSYMDIEYDSTLTSPKYKLALLVNEMSASASEIVAGAIQDTKAGVLIGTNTFGKAKFQGMIPLLTPEAYVKYGSKTVNAFELQNFYGIIPLQSEIAGYTKMTLGYYYTPNGRMIDGYGLMPDLMVLDPKQVGGVDVTSIQMLSASSSVQLNSQGGDVGNAEKMLKVMGYDVSTPDSTLDAKTAEALKKYQKASKLSVSGILDTQTQKALNASFEKLLPGVDRQFAKALELLKK